MKNTFYVIILSILISACKNEKATESTNVDEVTKEDVTTSIYPKAITKVFDAHGGIDNWNTMQTLSFTIDKPNGKEVTTTHLKTRAELIETPTYAMGYDGENLWINEKDGNEYKGNAKFYKGLMMYFYAMPFIVGDNGIIYEETESLTFEGKTYPGILISYESGIGASPDDQYKIYFDDNTGEMVWLAYTVTFGKNEKSTNFSFIRYNDWLIINGLKLPKSIAWYQVENNEPVKERSVIAFNNVLLSKEAPDNKMFNKPDGAKIIE
ncbi:DUF6503 family protein [Winogradskyella sp.]|jgi:hypothetical protein|uniref:DUF6503 family protein n=1 Tax=Winogradskyella sp. TaxID=1883156 RepID=UPI0025EDBAD3|nr:DUF6503 family protein [Winogradskyella sp.]MCT4628781.1 DUF6503 family protein [Winogradskyella sp.]